jgi:hypothetical protein
MLPPISASSSAQLPDVASSRASNPGNKPVESAATPAESRAQLNTSIIQATLEVSISTQNEPLVLLLKSAITGINELLEPEFGPNAIQNAVSQDNTPEGTAGRIVSLSTGFFEAFKQQHAGEDEAAVLGKFMATIRSGFEQGYNEARDILQGLRVLSGDIASNIEKTYALVQQGYAEFEAARSRQSDTAPTVQA